MEEAQLPGVPKDPAGLWLWRQPSPRPAPYVSMSSASSASRLFFF